MTFASPQVFCVICDNLYAWEGFAPVEQDVDVPHDNEGLHYQTSTDINNLSDNSGTLWDMWHRARVVYQNQAHTCAYTATQTVTHTDRWQMIGA